ncbi:MAG: hypothetical protein R3267_12605 [Paenisporosarcina sp.]|nr:hypothetical protein [Paenisporosarcina sp.]
MYNLFVNGTLVNKGGLDIIAEKVQWYSNLSKLSKSFLLTEIRIELNQMNPLDIQAATYHEEYVQFHKEHGMTVEEADIRTELIKEQNL